MVEPKVWVFFYGSYMNFDVLKDVNLFPEQWEVARVNGYDIMIQPRANLIRSDRTCVYGILATATHAELDRLYAHAQSVLGETYLPEPVLAGNIEWYMEVCSVLPRTFNGSEGGRERLRRAHCEARYGIPFPGVVHRAA